MANTFINLTPHTINLVNPNNNYEILISFESKGSVRVSMEKEFSIQDGIPVGKIKYTSLDGLPDPQPNTYYILSSIAFNKAKEIGRTDICFPAGEMFRDQDGNIIGVEFISFDNV